MKEILKFCKNIEGLEAEHGSLVVASVTDNRKLQSTKNSTRNSGKRKRDSNEKHNSESRDKNKMYCPIHGYGSHTAKNCHFLKDAIAKGKSKYSDRRKEYSRKDNKKFSKQEVSVMISSACEQALNCAIKVYTAVTSKKT